MHVSKCLEVFVRFASPNHQGVRISYMHGDTRSQHLRIDQTADRLTISFCDKEGEVIKSINYNYAHVLEWSTEGWVR